MPRTFVVDKKTQSLNNLTDLLLKANLSNAQTASAIEAVKALNPGLNLERLPADTVIFVPDSPGFKVSVSDSVSGAPLGDLQQLARQALDGAAKDLKAGNATRAAERADVTAAMKIAAVARMVADDAELKQLAADATKAFKEEQQQADQAEQALATASKAALAKLTELSKLVS
jgi:hypothetical protein